MRAARAVLVAGLLLLVACGSAEDRVVDHLTSQYGRGTGSGDDRSWTADDPVGTVTARIVRVEEPAARAADGGAEYLRYDDAIVTVTPSTAATSSTACSPRCSTSPSARWCSSSASSCSTP